MKEKEKFTECDCCHKQIYEHDKFITIVKSLEKLVIKGHTEIDVIKYEDVLTFCKKCGDKISKVSVTIDGKEIHKDLI